MKISISIWFIIMFLLRAVVICFVWNLVIVPLTGWRIITIEMALALVFAWTICTIRISMKEGGE
jgi:hypothetical protein